MKIERLEAIFMVVVAFFLFGAIAALLATIAGEHAAFPESSERVDPATVTDSAPFDEPGVFANDDGSYDVIMIARTWAFEPAEITVPEDAEIRFRVVSTDVIHGMRIPGTNANSMIIPGQISEVDVTFDDPDVYSLLCHEYCGLQHHRMGGRINVVPADEFALLDAAADVADESAAQPEEATTGADE